MMLVLSFRLKLMLAMTLVVGGVTVTTLLVAQDRAEANSRKLALKLFAQKMHEFALLREARLRAARAQCLQLSTSVRLLAAIDADMESAQLRDIAKDELRELPQDYLQVLDAKAKALISTSNAADPALSDSLDRQLAGVRRGLAGEGNQLVGYLTASDQPPLGGTIVEVDPTNLVDVVVTKILDPSDGKMLGALAVGFKSSVPAAVSSGSTAGAQGSTGPLQAEQIPSGILIGNCFYAASDAIAPALGTVLAAQLAETIQRAQRLPTDFESLIGGTHYRVYCEALPQARHFPPAYQVCLYSLEEARRDERDLRWKIAGSGGAAFLGAVALSWLLSVGLSVPINELVAGTTEIQRGNYAVRVPIRSQDEIGRLAGSFNQMAVGLAEREKYRNFLSMVSDKAVADQLIQGGVELGGEMREVSALFCDIRGFTALTHDMAPVAVIELLNHHMTLLTKVVHDHHGIVDKFVGDLIMAVFGAPKSQGQDALHAVQCALRMVEERAALNQRSQPPVFIGIGVASGPVVAGCMGSTDRLNYTVLGARVNLASRLCSKARAGEAVIDQTTRERLGSLITVEELPSLDLKGFSAPVPAFKLLQVRHAKEPGQSR